MNIEINIHKNAIGWLDLTIDDHKFTVSYLSDFKREMEELLSLPYISTWDTRRIILEGEGPTLYLTAWRRETAGFYLIWEEYFTSLEENIFVLKYPNYEEFKRLYQQAFKKVEKLYEEKFVFRSDLE
jgi:hypothetical protein